jgi:hypothetical protein
MKLEMGSILNVKVGLGRGVHVIMTLFLESVLFSVVLGDTNY